MGKKRGHDGAASAADAASDAKKTTHASSAAPATPEPSPAAPASLSMMLRSMSRFFDRLAETVPARHFVASDANAERAAVAAAAAAAGKKVRLSAIDKAAAREAKRARLDPDAPHLTTVELQREAAAAAKAKGGGGGDGVPRTMAAAKSAACLLYTSPSPRD